MDSFTSPECEMKIQQKSIFLFYGGRKVFLRAVRGKTGWLAGWDDYSSSLHVRNMYL